MQLIKSSQVFQSVTRERYIDCHLLYSLDFWKFIFIWFLFLYLYLFENLFLFGIFLFWYMVYISNNINDSHNADKETRMDFLKSLVISLMSDHLKTRANVVSKLTFLDIKA